MNTYKKGQIMKLNAEGAEEMNTFLETGSVATEGDEVVSYENCIAPFFSLVKDSIGMDTVLEVGLLVSLSADCFEEGE